MTGLSHVTTGVLIAVAVQKPALALPLALLSHFALDRFPHWGNDLLDGSSPLFRRIILYDVLACLSVVIFMMFALPAQALVIALSAALAVAPDMMWIPNFFREVRGLPVKPRNAVMRWHASLQYERNWGIATEGFWLLVIVVLLWHDVRL